MGFKPGQSGYPQGRAKGTHNHDLIAIKQAYTDLITHNLPKIQRWLDRVATENPEKALDFLMKLSPFVVPKKTESDITIDNPIRIVMPENDSLE